VSNPVLEVVARQRACRSFAPTEVNDEAISALLTAATKAPSSENKQPWVFVVVRDVGRRRAIGLHLKAVWEAEGIAYSQSRLEPGLFRDVDQGQRGGIADAPVLLVVGGDSSKVPKRWLSSSIFPAVQNILLAAGSLGLGSALTTLATADAAAFGSLVGLPDHILPLAMLPIGWPRRPLGPPRREPFEGHTYRETFGRPW
jgi:nitroreductase